MFNPRRFSFVIIALFVTCSVLDAQFQKPEVDDASQFFTNQAATPSGILEVPLAGVAGIHQQQTPWSVRVKSNYPKKHYGEEVEKIKERKNLLKGNDLDGIGREPSSVEINPIVKQDFDANWMLNGAPADDAMAVSNSGYIVACNNDGIEYYTTNALFISGEFWSDFFNNSSLNANIFDPKVEYDSGADRFVMTVLHGSDPSSSVVLMCFSKSNDPRDGWNYYILTGNPLNRGNWFDYPNLGVSTNEVYVTGNLFNSQDQFDQAVIYQITKSTGYNGSTIQWQYWSGLTNAPFNAFTLVPAVFGQQGNYGPGIYFVSNRSGGSDQIRFWDLTDDLTGMPQIRTSNYQVRAYEPAGDARQLNSNELLDNGDCRIQDAFYLNEKLHFIFHTDIGDGWNGLSYNKIDVRNMTIEESRFGLQGSFDYSYPGLVSYSSNVSDEAAMIGFLRSSSQIYPEIRVVSIDENLDWSSSVQVKSGDTYVDIVRGDERWGDYISMSRKHNSSEPTVWMSASYGANIPERNTRNTYKTRIAEIGGMPVSTDNINDQISEYRVYPNPVENEFTVDFVILEKAIYTIDVYDHLGRVVRHLFNDKLKKGQHQLSFNKDALLPGSYHVVISTSKKIIKDEKLIIPR